MGEVPLQGVTVEGAGLRVFEWGSGAFGVRVKGPLGLRVLGLGFQI